MFFLSFQTFSKSDVWIFFMLTLKARHHVELDRDRILTVFASNAPISRTNLSWTLTFALVHGKRRWSVNRRLPHAVGSNSVGSLYDI